MRTRINRASPIAVATIAVAALVAACSGGGTAPATLEATCDDFAATPNVAATAELAVGGELTIVLCSNQTTGFLWEEPIVGDPAVVAVTGSTYVEPTSDEPVVGAAGSQEIVLEALAAGTSTVTVAYSRPWEGGEKGVWTYEVTVTVR
ncbi:MAG: hypothetical protein RL338_400 [Chloroflexota bacterium]|jgi:inhibitor of cysteine peptidase